MKKRFLLMTMVLAVGLGSSGCVLSDGSEFETITDAGISNAEEIDVSEEETLIVVETSEAVLETDESMGQEVFSDITKSYVDSEEPEAPEVTELPEAPEETESVETTESNPEPATETTSEIPREEPAEEVTEEPEKEAFVAYDPNYVVALATEKTKAYGKILVWENLDRLLAEGSITQEEYAEYYPYDGLENSYYSVFVETDLNKASTTSGRLLVSEEGIADYIAEMLALETGPYFAISYAGIYKGTSGDFYEFRCHR